MDYRRTSLVVNRQQQASTNSHTYASFAGAGTGLRTHGILFETPTMWWDEERIESTVTPHFVASKLRPDEQIRLDEQLGFGDGLTDDTYMEWIELKAKRIFLILVDLGVPDQIFGVIDDSWDDDDLPIPLDQVERLQLTYDKDEKLEKKFFHRQFYYLLRNIQKGEHVYYDDEEVVPLELAERRPVGAVTALTNTSNVDKVHLPGRPDDLFHRRRVPLGNTTGRMPMEEFLSGIEALKVIDHKHLTSLWASYIHQGYGYLLFTPVHDSTLKSFLAVTPQSIKILAKQDRRALLLNWMHCLADGLAFLHKLGMAHGNIKPSNVMLDMENNIFFGDSGVFSTSNLDGDKQGFDKEVYDYSAPEAGPRPPAPPPVFLPVSRPLSRHGSTTRRPNGPSNFDAPPLSPSTTSTASFSFPPSPPRTNSNLKTKHDPQKSDIFSMGTIFLEILTFFLKRASRNFASHRASKNKTPGRGGGLPDSSFHKNLGQVESWMDTLTKDAKKKEDKLFRGIPNIVILCREMLRSDPDDRPSATEIQERLYNIIDEQCGLGHTTTEDGGISSKIHCESQEVQDNAFNFGFEQLRLQSQEAAAAACASVNSTTGAVGTLGYNGQVIYGVERTQSVVSGFGAGFGGMLKRDRSKDQDRMSIATKTSSGSGGKSKSGSANTNNSGNVKIKPKVKAWQAPVYSGTVDSFFLHELRKS